MKEIGGYFELELRKGDVFHTKAIKLNDGRNGLEYVLRAKKFSKLYLPYFVCEVVLQPPTKLNIEYEFYNVDLNLDPVFDKKIGENEAFLYVNYFGLKQKTVEKLKKSIPNLIIDSTQAFFQMPYKNTDTFYSARKFFGVADGGFLYTDKLLDKSFDIDISYKKMQHLLQRIEEGAPSAYKLFIQADDDLDYNDIEQMSKLTLRILQNVDYEKVKSTRETNFKYLHSKLGKINDLSIVNARLNGPMYYPFLIKDDSIRNHLIKNKIYVPTYWPNTFKWCSENSTEYYLAKYILPLPIDQRYDLLAMQRIIEVMKEIKIG